MIPTAARGGTSFKGAAAYYLHDKDARSAARVAWTHTENLPTNDPERAWKIMAYTATHQKELKAAAGVPMTGRKLQAPVYSFSLAWHPEQKPDKAHMLDMMRQALVVLGLAEHQALIVAHQDEPQPHAHAIVCRVHPVTGRAATVGRDWRKLQKLALDYERQHGKIYCSAREKNAQSRAERKPERQRNSVIQAAYAQSDSGKAFQAALKAKGYILAQGNRRIVVVDPYGKVRNPTRELPGVRAAVLKARLADLDLRALPTAAAVQKEIKLCQRRQYHASRRFEAWSAEYLNNNQDRQIEERAALGTRYTNRLRDKKEELEQHYRRTDRAGAVEQLRDRVAHPSLFRRITGKAAQESSALEAKELQLADIDRRIGEQIGAITTEHGLATADLATRHARENELAQQYLAERREALGMQEQIGQERSSRGGGGHTRDDQGGRERTYQRHERRELPFTRGLFW